LPDEAPLGRGLVDRLAARRLATRGWLVPHRRPEDLPRADRAVVAQPEQLLLTWAQPRSSRKVRKGTPRPAKGVFLAFFAFLGVLGARSYSRHVTLRRGSGR